MDTNLLFEKYTIEEIRNIEKKTRQDIETKKEDLRQMVGERYRDLIEAADTITEMKTSAENVTKSIARMQELCQNLRQLPAEPTRTEYYSKRETPKRPREMQFYQMAAQMKVLMTMPEMIWSALDTCGYLQASRLFLLARHINTSLQLDSQQSAKILACFPVLARQWAAISHFRSTILQSCREMLRVPRVSDQTTTECLCSILLLEDCTPRQVFTEFLLARTTAVQQLLQPDQTGVTVKSQVCDVAEVITTTLRQIYTIFYHFPERKQSQEPFGLLINTLKRVTTHRVGDSIITELNISVSQKHLPEYILEFVPALQNPINAVSAQNLRANCQQWIQTCVNDVRAGLSRLLGFVTTIKGLSVIRNAVWDILKQDENVADWEKVCKQILDRNLPVWEEFFQPLFLERTEALLQSQLENALVTCKNQVGKVLTDIANTNDRSTASERDISSYIWAEVGQDVSAHTGWMSACSKSLANGSSLMMKARAYTPSVQGLCRSFDGKLKTLLEDGGHYLVVPEDTTDTSVFEKMSDRQRILHFLQNTGDSCIVKLLEHLNHHLYAMRQQLSNSQDTLGNRTIIDRVLTLARFSAALCDLSPHLQQCMTGTGEKFDGLGIGKKAHGTRGQTKVQENPKWTELQGKLHVFTQDAYRVWTEHTSQCLVNRFRRSLLDRSGHVLLLSSTRWDQIEIEEETEDGKKIKSAIRVPVQSSGYVQSTLYALCEEVNRAGGHALNRPTLYTLIEQLSDGMVSAYEQLMTNYKSTTQMDYTSLPLTQNAALQMIFDIRFISSVMPRKDESEVNKTYQRRLSQLLEALDAVVDPFDLDVFSPHMESHLFQHVQRNNVLFGALSSLDKHALYTSGPRTASAVHHEEHNVLELSTRQSRFTLLPLSMQGSTSHSQPIVQPPKPKTSPIAMATGPSSPPPALSPQMEQNTSSFLGQMSTIWFSNVTSK